MNRRTFLKGCLSTLAAVPFIRGLVSTPEPIVDDAEQHFIDHYENILRRVSAPTKIEWVSKTPDDILVDIDEAFDKIMRS